MATQQEIIKNTIEDSFYDRELIEHKINKSAKDDSGKIVIADGYVVVRMVDKHNKILKVFFKSDKDVKGYMNKIAVKNEGSVKYEGNISGYEVRLLIEEGLLQ